jgi:hypothetical protein
MFEQRLARHDRSARGPPRRRSAEMGVTWRFAGSLAGSTGNRPSLDGLWPAADAPPRDEPGRRTEVAMLATGAVTVALVAIALLTSWKRLEAFTYGDPFGCRTITCARQTTADAELAHVDEALDLIAGSAYARFGDGRRVAATAQTLAAQGRVNVWSLRELDHSRYDRQRGIMLNRAYEPIDARLVAVAIVHESVHAWLGRSTYRNEVRAYEEMLRFYDELVASTGWHHAELDYLADQWHAGTLTSTLRCEDIFRGPCG